jgi:hypothetical protein
MTLIEFSLWGVNWVYLKTNVGLIFVNYDDTGILFCMFALGITVVDIALPPVTCNHIRSILYLVHSIEIGFLTCRFYSLLGYVPYCILL